MKPIDHSDLRRRGNVGEDTVAQYLTDHGCTILARNYTTRGGEIDIIAENEARILFVEVKARAETENLNRYGRPASAVRWEKQKRIIAAAQSYLTAHPNDRAVRFDVAEVFLSKSTPPIVLDLHYIKGAFMKIKGRNANE